MWVLQKCFLDLKPAKVDVKSCFYIPFERASKELSNGMLVDFLALFWAELCAKENFEKSQTLTPRSSTTGAPNEKRLVPFDSSRKVAYRVKFLKLKNFRSCEKKSNLTKSHS